MLDRRKLLAGLTASALMAREARSANMPNSFIELKTWLLHNTAEDQGARVSEFLSNGLAPALSRSGAKLIGAFANVIGPDGPYYVSLTRHSSLNAMGETLTRLDGDEGYAQAIDKLGAGAGLPFVRVESSLLRSFDVLPEPVIEGSSGKARIFELRTYESQSFATLKRKIGMFNHGEARIFEKLGMRPVFFGETIIGPKQPNLVYMLSFDDLAARERLWQAFGSDPDWKKLSATPGLKDPEIVANIGNVILRPLPFSPIR